MSDSLILDDDSDADERTVTLKRSQIRSIEQKAREADKLAERLNRMERETALLKSGIDLNNPTGKLFAEHYNGDATVEAVLAKASEYGLAPKNDLSHDDELKATKRVADAASGSGGDREIDLLDAWREAVSSGKGAEEILRIAHAAGLPVAGDD